MQEEDRYPLYVPIQKRPLPFDEMMEQFLRYVQSRNLEMYPAQEEAILEAFSGSHILLNTPTGSGKSLVATGVHFHSLASAKRSIYTSPIKALVNEKFLALCRDFGPQQVGLLTGDAAVNREAPILCCTAEILSNIGLQEGEGAFVHDVIMDEFHYYGDFERGVAWQIPLLTMPQCRFVLMSATMGDPAFFAEFLQKKTHRKCSIIVSTHRPVPLDFEYREDPMEQTVVDLLEAGKAPIYLVHFTQRECAENAQSFVSLSLLTKAEKKTLSEAVQDGDFATPYGKEMKRLLRHGVGVHHAGLLPKYRLLVESLAQQGLLKIICGTDTLGVGVNIPIRTVLFTKLCKFDGQKTVRLKVRDFHQIAGRAGRKGFDDQGYVVVQAPEHIIEAKKRRQKAAARGANKKAVSVKAPEKGYVHWDESIFQRLIHSPPERLVSRFSVTHGMLLQVLSRTSDGCEAMRQLIRECHETDVSKAKWQKRAFQLFRDLVQRKIIEIVPKELRGLAKVQVNLDLQEDFSLHQTLSLYVLDTLNHLDPFSETYPFDILSVIESTIENPQAILFRQQDVAKREAMGQMKSQGMDFEDRIAELDKITYPKPLFSFLDHHFVRFCEKHPWVEGEDIQPKSIAREMYENYYSFHEYVRLYQLERIEGLLLRYLSNVYKVLDQTVPDLVKNDDIDEMELYLVTMIRRIDSSLLDEWTRLQQMGSGIKKKDRKPVEPAEDDFTQDPALFKKHIRASLFQFLRALANRQYEEALDLTVKAYDITPGSLERTMTPFWESHGQIRTDAASRRNTLFQFQEDRKKRPHELLVEVIFPDPEQHHDWHACFVVDRRQSSHLKVPALCLTYVGEIGAQWNVV